VRVPLCAWQGLKRGKKLPRKRLHSVPSVTPAHVRSIARKVGNCKGSRNLLQRFSSTLDREMVVITELWVREKTGVEYNQLREYRYSRNSCIPWSICIVLNCAGLPASVPATMAVRAQTAPTARWHNTIPLRPHLLMTSTPTSHLAMRAAVAVLFCRQRAVAVSAWIKRGKDIVHWGEPAELHAPQEPGLVVQLARVPRRPSLTPRPRETQPVRGSCTTYALSSRTISVPTLCTHSTHGHSIESSHL
jgi:hypothetical protein